MRFVDEVTIEVRGGRGGDGCLSFRRGPNLPKGGPDGGNGGRGGNVVLCGSLSLNTLVDFTSRRLLVAKNGKRGGSNEKRGASGEDLIVPVPCGTTVIDDETLYTLGDVRDAGQELCVAKGGAPGRGNASFRSSVNRAPRHVTEGREGESRRLRFHLKVLADVGLLGLPNAGKSTLIARVSASRPKIADYAFTTLHPNLGVVRTGVGDGFVMADIPGLLPGAASGTGLGTRFLRHLSRTRILLHLVDCVPVDGSDPIKNLCLLEDELYRYSEGFRKRKIWIVLNKIDAATVERVRDLTGCLEEKIPNRQIVSISGLSGEGVSGLVEQLADDIGRFRQGQRENPEVAVAETKIQELIFSDVLRNEIDSRRGRDNLNVSDPSEVWKDWDDQ